MNKHQETIKIVIIYALFGCSWIYFSDTALGWLVRDPEIMTKIAIFKGLLFMALTSILLFFLINRLSAKIKQSTNALHESEERLRFLVKNSSDSLVIVNADGSQRYVSPAAERITGYPIAELEGRALDTLIHPDDMKDIQAAWNEAVAHPEKTVTVQYRHIHKTRGWVFSEAIAQSFLTEPAINGVIANVRDITERKQAEKVINNSNKLLQTIINTAPMSIFFKDTELRYMGCNKAFAADAGIECPEDLIGKDDYQMVWREQADLYRTDDLRVIESGAPKLSYDEPQTTPDGHLIWLRTSKVPLRNEDNKIIGVLGMYEDITDRKRMEEALQESERKYRSLVETTDTGYVILDDKGFVLDANLEYVHLTGRQQPEEVIGHSVLEWTAPHDLERNATDVRRCVEQGYVRNLEINYVHPAGQVIPVEINATVLRTEGTIRILSLCRDITERKRAEEQLKESEDKFSLTFKSSPDAVNIYRLDDGLCVDINEGFTRTTGFTRDDFIGKTSLELNIWRDPADRERLVQGIREKGFCENLEAQFRKKDGSLITGLMSARVILLKGVPHIISITRDITELKKHENEQLKIEKLESLGVLAGGIAHDFNNILTGIMGNISFAKVFLDAAHKSCKPLAEAERAAVRAGELAHQLLTFARGGEPIKKVVSPQHLVNEALSFILHGSNVKGTVDIPDSIHAFEADEGQISQVFQNIIINATQAMPGGGILTITAQNEELDDNNTLSLLPGSYIRLTFADQGCGISDDNLKRIFDPYFTTKSAGIGLGLSSVHSIVNRHGGHIEAVSAVGKGTTFTIHLPSIGKVFTEYQEEVAMQATGEHTGGSILVMDDDEMIRDVASSMLTHLGYEVTICADGEEAVELYKTSMKSGAPFVMAIMDLTIPGGLGGKQAAEQILSLFPKACLVVSSGYSNDPIMSNYREHGFSGAIAKPYNIHNFKEVLGLLLTH